jgi:DnaJ-class molecular chaperone
MTGAVLDRPGTQQFELDGGLTLEELLNSALHEAHANGSTDCPVCHARMNFARPGAREAECGGCGSRLS